jgi:hypothetical protein
MGTPLELQAADVVGPLVIELLLQTATIWRLKSFDCWTEKAVADREGGSSLHTSSTLPSTTAGRR